MNSLLKRILTVVFLFGCTAVFSYTHSISLGICGDGIIDAGIEQCDGPVSITCTDYGFNSGVVACNSCIIDSSGCFNGPIIVTPVCGNGIVESGEVCDGSTTSTCADFGFDSGTVSCTGSCTVDSSGCFNAPVCGNGVVESGEVCDGSTTSTCTNFGFDSGTVSCTGSCTVDSSGCFNAPVCGDGMVEGTEQCDDGTNNAVACTPMYGSSCTYCSGSCEDIMIAGGTCGDGIVQSAQEECDAGSQNGVVCTGGCTYCSSSCTEIVIASISGKSSTISSSTPLITATEQPTNIQELPIKKQEVSHTTQCFEEGYIVDRFAALSVLPVEEVTVLPTELEKYFTASFTAKLERFLSKISSMEKDVKNSLIEKIVCKIETVKSSNTGNSVKESILQYIQDRVILLYVVE